VAHTFDAEERELLRATEAGDWVSVPDLATQKAHLEAAARSTRTKTERITLRLSAVDLTALKLCAAREGLPYQTLMTSVLHKYVTGQLTVAQRQVGQRPLSAPGSGSGPALDPDPGAGDTVAARRDLDAS
jgi:predicted DNA binding CopG/RHH family protein